MSKKPDAEPLRQVKSCGVLVMRRQPRLSFLLMEHADRLDLPKGHVDAGETELECALRELVEETGIHADQITLDREFRFEEQYYPPLSRYGGDRVEKTLVIFLAWLDIPCDILLTEHAGYRWVDWAPPHDLQANTINPLLKKVQQFLAAPCE